MGWIEKSVYCKTSARRNFKIDQTKTLYSYTLLRSHKSDTWFNISHNLPLLWKTRKKPHGAKVLINGICHQNFVRRPAVSTSFVVYSENVWLLAFSTMIFDSVANGRRYMTLQIHMHVFYLLLCVCAISVWAKLEICHKLLQNFVYFFQN